ncbi:MAG TPA: penicillin-binding protein 2 [Thermoanaerobaculia bacterium]|nr:penicillin-binding protein 2 [Thermoanaerobaculia bacterium]
MKRRLLFVVAGGAIWVALIGARLYQLQVVRYDHYAGKAERQQQRVVTLDPPRGTIYDAQGRELAVSVQVDSAYAVPPEIEDPAAAAQAIAGIVPGLDVKKLTRQLASDREFVWVARKLDPPVAAAVRRLDLEGLYFLPESKRYYPMRELASQILGYVGTDNHGLAGLELLYDEQVAGKPVIRTVLRDARRGTVVSPELSFADPEPGADLHLTLDAAVQHVVERELARAVEERGASRGIAVFLDPRTGGVLAMASYPGFDPNEFGKYPSSRWRNRAIGDVYEPGSTFKVITAAAALGSGLVRAEDEFDCEMGGVVVYGKLIRDHKPFGRLTFAEVLAKSSNVGVIKAALLMGDERLYSAVRGFGFGEPTGIDLPGESGGIVHPLERWNNRAKAYVSFGQGISVTPLQLARAIAAIANEGSLLKPHVVAAMGRGGSLVPTYPELPVTGRPISPQTARELKRLLEGVVMTGTGKAAGVPGYRVAGKTGTAQIPVAGGYHRSHYLPSFVGFAPADRPAIVGVVAIAEPKGFAYHGGQVAAPVFGAVARQVLLYLGIRPQRDPLVLWPGETPGQVVTASLPPAPPSGDHDEGDTLVQEGSDILLRDPPPGPAAPSGTSQPESDHTSPEGGRSHAPF